MKRKQAPRLALGAAALTVAAACGGGGGGGGSTPAAPSAPGGTGTGSGATTIRITASGVEPKQLRISVGERVTFVNEDTRSHEMMSDPHPLHTGCPEINQIGDLGPGQSRTTGTFSATRNCGFHDNRQDGVAALRGNIVVGDAGNPSDYY